MNRFALVRELVKDPSLRVTEIAWKTGYNKGHVSRLRKELIKQTADYERGVVDGMQRQMQSSVDKAINRQPTKILGPNLEQVLNSAGYYKKREWVSLTDDEINTTYEEAEKLVYESWNAGVSLMFPTLLYSMWEAKWREKNHG